MHTLVVLVFSDFGAIHSCNVLQHETQKITKTFWGLKVVPEKLASSACYDMQQV